MRRPRCGTCRHWVPDEGMFAFCGLLPPALDTPGPHGEPRTSQPIVAHWGGCAQHERHFGRSLKALWARLRLQPGNDPKRINRQ